MDSRLMGDHPPFSMETPRFDGQIMAKQWHAPQRIHHNHYVLSSFRSVIRCNDLAGSRSSHCEAPELLFDNVR